MKDRFYKNKFSKIASISLHQKDIKKRNLKIEKKYFTTLFSHKIILVTVSMVVKRKGINKQNVKNKTESPMNDHFYLNYS